MTRLTDSALRRAVCRHKAALRHLQTRNKATLADAGMIRIEEARLKRARRATMRRKRNA